MSLFGDILNPLGMLSGGSAHDLLFGQTPNMGPATDLFNKLSQQQQMQNMKAMAFQNAGLQAIKGSYATAKQGVTSGASSAKMELGAQGQQAQAANQQSAMNRGVYNTSTFDMGARGISSDLARHLAMIDASTQQTLGQLDVGQGQATAQGYAGLAGLASNLSNQQTQLAGPMFGLYGDLFKAQSQNHGLAGGLLGLAGAAIGAA